MILHSRDLPHFLYRDMICLIMTVQREKWSVLSLCSKLAMAGHLLFLILISATNISALFLPLPPPPVLPGFVTRVQDSRSPPAPAPIWILWDLASSSSSVIGRSRDKPTDDYHYDFNIGEKGDENFMAHDETRDSGVVSGSYSYVDPLGNLITVQYTADADGYTETRFSVPN